MFTADFVASRTVAWFPHSGGPSTPHGLGWGVEKGRGYDPMFEDHVLPMIAAGVRRFGVWMPDSLGVMTDQARQALNLDARQDLKEIGLGALVSDLGYWVRRTARKHPQVRWILYVGSALEPDLQGLKAKKQALAYTRRFLMQSVGHFLDIPQASIAWDHRATYAPGSPEVKACEYVDAIKWATGCGDQPAGYIEGPPERVRLDQRGLAVCCTEAFWRRSRPVDDVQGPGFTDSRWALPSQEIGQEVVRIDQGAMGNAAEVLGRVAHVVGHPAGGHVYAGGLNYVIGPGRAFASMEAFAEALAATAALQASQDAPVEPELGAGGPLDVPFMRKYRGDPCGAGPRETCGADDGADGEYHDGPFGKAATS